LREDNVRKIWSDAELDAALSDLHDDVDEDDGLAFARASLMAAAGTSEAPPQPRRSGTWRWIAVAAAVVTLVGGLAIVTSLRTSAPEPTQPAAMLPDVDRPLAPGEYHYTQKLSWLPELLEGLPVKMQQRVELWIPADPTGVWHRRTGWTGAVSGLDAGTEKKVHVNLAPFDEHGPDGRFAGGQNLAGHTDPRWNTPFQNWLTPDAAFIASLTPDRGKLVKRLTFDTISTSDSGKAHTATESLIMARNALETGLLGKELRLALRDALSQVVGLVAKPGQSPGGGPATIVIAKDTGQRLFFDPATAQLLAWDTPTPPTAVTSTDRVSRSTNVPPPSSAALPLPTKTTQPATPEFKFGEPEAVYSFAITRTSG
jgi:hypothetical protein